MIKTRISFAVIFLIAFFMPLFSLVNAQNLIRKEINIPNIPGYITLKCDLHMHTVFSDGTVWPTVRPLEAWIEGLDAIAITDHIEVQPHKSDIPKNHNRPYEIAKEYAKELGIILIKGAEITREMPPGHFNAIFLKDINPLDTKEWQDSLKAAVDQSAFIFWNHPGWPAGKSIWYQEHEELYQKGWIKGIEIVNEYEYYPEALEWCLEKNLAVIGNSDVHEPMNIAFDLKSDGHRPLTLVFVKERSEDGIKEALLAQRSVVFWKNMIIGSKNYVSEIFKESINVINTKLTINGKSNKYLHIRNNSDINYELELEDEIEELLIPKSFYIPANSTALMTIFPKSESLKGEKEFVLKYKAKNMIVSPDECLSVNIRFTAKFNK